MPRGILGTNNGARDAFSLAVPPGARFEGLAGRRTSTGIVALAFAYSYPPSADTTGGVADLLANLTTGVWIDRDQPEPSPVKERRKPRVPHGTFEDQSVFRFRYSPLTGILTLADAAARPAGGAISFAGNYRKAPGLNQWAGVDHPERSISVFSNRIQLLLSAAAAGGGVSGSMQTLIRPAAYPSPDQDQLPWGATFSLDHRPNAVGANFKGYLPFYMNVHNFQATTGASGEVFERPSDSSRDYYTTSSRVIVPYGLHFKLDNHGSERTSMVRIDSEIDRQNSWSLGLGYKVAVQALACFGIDFNHQEGQEVVDKFEYSMLQDRATVVHYSLVLDPGRMRLSKAFRARVGELRDRLVTGLPVDWQQFFKHFGTHYANAVTYGGSAWTETVVNTSSFISGANNETSISREASATLEDTLSLSNKIAVGWGSGTRIGLGTATERSTFGTYGGSFSKGGGWSVARGEELPVLLDLRPLHELLSPAFFEDEVVYRTVREAMGQAYASFSRSLAGEVKKNRPWAADVDVERMAGQ